MLCAVDRATMSLDEFPERRDNGLFDLFDDRQTTRVTKVSVEGDTATAEFVMSVVDLKSLLDVTRRTDVERQLDAEPTRAGKEHIIEAAYGGKLPMDEMPGMVRLVRENERWRVFSICRQGSGEARRPRSRSALDSSLGSARTGAAEARTRIEELEAAR